MGWGRSILNNFWPKVISLSLAVATWFYVFDLVNSDSFNQQDTLEDVLVKYKFYAKKVSIKPVFYGKSPEGYKVDFDKVRLDPPTIAIFGPEQILLNVDDLETDKIDLSEYTRSVKLSLGLHSASKYLQLDGKAVDVYIPVGPIEKEKEKAKEIEKDVVD